MTIFDTKGQFEAFHVASPLFNKNVGRQDFDYIAAPLVYTRNFALCELPEAELAAFAQGKIVFIDRFDGQFWDMGAGREHAECLAKVGARAAIKAYHKIRSPGMGAHAHTRATQDPESSIPLLHINFNSIPASVMQRMRLGDSSIIANVTADPNEWETLWDSLPFLGIWKVILPLMNFGGVILGLAACGTLMMHMRYAAKQQVRVRLSPLKRRMRNANMRLLMLSNVILTCTCFIRLFYCLSGPLYSSFDKSMDFHLILLDVTIVWESTASTAAIMIFHFWASFGMPKGERKIHTMLGFLAVIAFPLYLGLTIVYGVKASRAGIISLLVKPALLATISGIVSIIYVYRVLKFLRQSMAVGTQSNQSHRKHIGTFISIASAMNVTAFWGIVVAELTLVGMTVHGRFASFTIIFFSLTIQAICQIIAFFPSINVLQNQGRVVHEQGTLARELRCKRHFNSKVSKGSSEVHPKLTVEKPCESEWNNDVDELVRNQVVFGSMLALTESPAEMPRHVTKTIDSGAEDDELEPGRVETNCNKTNMVTVVE